MTLNCAAIPDGLIESELFGHVKGAFTGANRDHLDDMQRAHRRALALTGMKKLGVTRFDVS